jgi:hypothetical protein
MKKYLVRLASAALTIPASRDAALDEPRPRGTLLGQRADRRRVREVEHIFRCKACNGWIDARDLVWVEDHETASPHPPQDQAQ